MHTFAMQSSIRPGEFVRNWTQIAGLDGSATALAPDRRHLARPCWRFLVQNAPRAAPFPTLLPGARGLDSSRYEGCRDSGAFFVVLRAERASARAVGFACSECVRPDGPAHHGGHAAVQAVLPRRGGATPPAPDFVPE